jgi:hypothetical protein
MKELELGGVGFVLVEVVHVELSEGGFTCRMNEDMLW